MKTVKSKIKIPTQYLKGLEELRPANVTGKIIFTSVVDEFLLKYWKQYNRRQLVKYINKTFGIHISYSTAYRRYQDLSEKISK